jgi:predicted nucleotidyltransferase
VRQIEVSEGVNKIKKILKKDANIVFALLFGSYVKGKQKEDSDIDLAIYFKKVPRVDAFLKLISMLTDITKKEVDVVVLNNASAMLRHQVFKNKQTLFIKDRNSYINFRLKTINNYEEYKHISGLNAYDR